MRILRRWLLGWVPVLVMALVPGCETPGVELPPPDYIPPGTGHPSDPDNPSTPDGPENPQGPDTPETPTDPRQVTYTLMTYNVGAFRKYESTLGHFSYPEVASIIRSVGPQVVGLNETDWNGSRTGGDHQAEELALLLGEKWHAKFWYAGYTWYGNSMVWDDALKSVKEYPRVHISKTDGAETRSMGAVEFEDFIFCTTHLDHKSETDRLNGVETLTDWARTQSAQTGKPIFLTGDMNAIPSSATVKRFLENWTWLSPNELTYNSTNPTKCIDYIFVYKDDSASGVRVKASGVIHASTNPTIKEASDHCPAWVTVTWTVGSTDSTIPQS